MFGKVVRKNNDLKICDIEIGVLFEVVDCIEKDFKGLICVKTYSNVVCLVGNDKCKAFKTTWRNDSHATWSVKFLGEEKVILSNKEFE